ncbi:MAG: YibE/F family protein [Microgenomates group bacterium]|jgi:uncharacterized membrane protein
MSYPVIKKFLFSVIAVILIWFSQSPVLAQEFIIPDERLEAQVVKVLEEKEIDVPGLSDSSQKQLYQKLELVVTQGSLKDQNIVIENGNLPMANVQRYGAGDEVVVTKTKDPDNKDLFYITDKIRRGALLWLALIFVALTFAVGRLKGIASLAGMGLSFLVIFMFILPKISEGADPILISILGSLLIIPITFYLSHGWNRKTTIAIFGTIIALIITGVLANIFVEAAKLTGFISEEANFLQTIKQGTINIRGLFLAGIIIGTLGVLDDVTVSQAAIVQQLKEANSKLKPEELYRRAMDIGKDHIASMVNTLILVYAGASLPLLLLFINNPHPFSEVINYEMIASEIIRTLVGSIGLILAVPITSIIAAASFSQDTDNFILEKG